MSDRDARVDPVVGDDVQVGVRQRKVFRVWECLGTNWVAWRGNAVPGRKRTTGNTLCLESWRKWARNAEVITRGAEKGTP